MPGKSQGWAATRVSSSALLIWRPEPAYMNLWSLRFTGRELSSSGLNYLENSHFISQPTRVSLAWKQGQEGMGTHWFCPSLAFVHRDIPAWEVHLDFPGEKHPVVGWEFEWAQRSREACCVCWWDPRFTVLGKDWQRLSEQSFHGKAQGKDTHSYPEHPLCNQLWVATVLQTCVTSLAILGRTTIFCSY